MHRRSVFAGLVLLVASRAASAQLTIRLTASDSADPHGAPIYIAGSFNQWNPGASSWMLARNADGSYGITLPPTVRGAVEFKFTLGSWERVEVGPGGAGVPNRSVLIPATGTATHDAVVVGWRMPASVPASRSTASRNVSILTDSFAIPALGRTRRVWLYLPPDYATSRARYPVLYMHDGQNVFDERTSFAGEWGVDETLDSLHALGDRGVIVVAVDNGGTHRMDEYDPWRSANAQLGGGEGDAYVGFLVHDLKPWIDQHYRTRRDPGHTGIMGSSMGGLISLYATLKHPEVFGRAGVFSCACWVADPAIYSYARHVVVPKDPPRFYFVSGDSETKEGQPARDQRRMVDTLAAAGFPTGSSIRAITPADGKHAEWFWRREFPAAYMWLFAESAGPSGRRRGGRVPRSHTAASGTARNLPPRP